MNAVADVVSGTGLSFPLLMEAIGPARYLLAIEHSAEMLGRERLFGTAQRDGRGGGAA